MESDFIIIVIRVAIIVAVVVVSYIVAKKFGEIAEMKGYPENQYFWFCFLLGLPGWLMIASLPDRKNREGKEDEPGEDLLPEL